jgi:twitching motility protein PilT
MAKLDRLLQALLTNGMDALVLEPGRLPRLMRGLTEHEVTKNVLDDAALRRLVHEVAPPKIAPPDDPGDGWSFYYQLDDSSFHFTVRSTGQGWSAVATPPSALEAAKAAAAPTDATEAPPEVLTEAQTEVPAEASGPDAQPLPGLDTLLQMMVEQGASDLHLSACQEPRLRLEGDLERLAFAPPTPDALEILLATILPERNSEELNRTNDTDFAYEPPGVARFRVNAFRDRLGFGVVFRQIPGEIPSCDELSLPETVRGLAGLSKGLVLVTGPTGSGKSTTLAAILDLANRSRHDHIITIEDPIEFVHTSKNCLVNQREVGVHTDSFRRALLAALREDPDILLVGEMRDLETTAIAVETAETGHLVFGTLPTTTAPSTVERNIDQFPADRQSQIRVMLANSLRAVVSQRLLKKIGGGLVAAFEILICTPAVSNLIREGKTFQLVAAIQAGQKHGMQTLDESLLSLVEKKLASPEEAYSKATDQETLAKSMAAAGLQLNLEVEPE